MAYALFSEDSKLSKAYPTEQDVWKVARDSGLVTDVASEDPEQPPRQILDHNYEIRECECDPGECPDRNKAEAGADKDFHDSLQGR
jgi:hypothetical protein